MRKEEAKYVAGHLKELTKERGGTILNLGSSSKHFREKQQPHIDRELFSPLRKGNIRLIHSDIKEEEGVDIPGNIFDVNIQEKLRAEKPDIILLCNMLEHLPVEQRGRIPKIINDILEIGSVVIITVPFSYPLHMDPIDTYYRPMPREILSLFQSYEVVDAKIVTSTNYYREYKDYDVKQKIKIIARLFLPVYKPKIWLCIIHRFFWLFRPYKISCIVLRKK